MLRRVLPLVCAALAAAGCSGSSGHKTTVVAPSDALAVLAQHGASASYTATYAFHQASPDTSATVKVWRAEPALRVDVVVASTTATLITASNGSFSCSITGAKRSCLLVAGPGKPVPAPFDVAPANLFGADLRTLATESTAYDVRAAPTRPAAGAVPESRCFDVSAATGAASPSPSTPPSGKVPSGRYCFTPDGILAAASYPSGNTVTLTSLQTAAPAASAFAPYAKPSPLPS